MKAQNILHFWFEELTHKQHFAKDTALDEIVRNRFGATLEAAARCDLHAWRATPEGALAEIIVLDQFSRNIYRDLPRAFAQDSMALALAQVLVASTSPLVPNCSISACVRMMTSQAAPADRMPFIMPKAPKLASLVQPGSVSKRCSRCVTKP